MSVAGRGLKVQVRPPHPLPLYLGEVNTIFPRTNARALIKLWLKGGGGGLGALIGRRAPYRVGVS